MNVNYIQEVTVNVNIPLKDLNRPEGLVDRYEEQLLSLLNAIRDSPNSSDIESAAVLEYRLGTVCAWEKKNEARKLLLSAIERQKLVVAENPLSIQSRLVLAGLYKGIANITEAPFSFEEITELVAQRLQLAREGYRLHPNSQSITSELVESLSAQGDWSAEGNIGVAYWNEAVIVALDYLNSRSPQEGDMQWLRRVFEITRLIAEHSSSHAIHCYEAISMTTKEIFHRAQGGYIGAHTCLANAFIESGENARSLAVIRPIIDELHSAPPAEAIGLRIQAQSTLMRALRLLGQTSEALEVGKQTIDDIEQFQELSSKSTMSISFWMLADEIREINEGSELLERVARLEPMFPRSYRKF